MPTRRRPLDHLAAESTQARDVPEGAARDRRIPVLGIAWHPDVSRVGERVALVELAADPSTRATVELSRLTPRFASADSEPYPLADRFLSRQPIRWTVGEAPGSLRLDIAGSGVEVQLDGVSVGGPIEIEAERLEQGVVVELAERVVLTLRSVRQLSPSATPKFGLVGESDGTRQVRREIQRVADLEMPVLLRGATGTGKELAAEAIHRAGARRQGPFVAVNLAAIPPSLAAAELFGATKGAYTGAAGTPGYFRQAAGGTLFLDEIGETSAELQALLLRVLECGEIQPVGAARPVPVDVRVVAATDADLDAAITAGTFREPLLHRLASYTIRLPTLADRRDDIGPLLAHFLRRELDALDRGACLDASADGSEPPWLGASLVGRLVRWDWPGNVRELRNVARRLAVAWSEHDQVPASAIDDVLIPSTPTEASAPVETPAPYKPPAEIDDDELLAALREHRFAARPTARALGISRTSLYALIERSSRIRKASDLDAEEIRRSLDEHAGDVRAAAWALEVSAPALQRRASELGLL